MPAQFLAALDAFFAKNLGITRDRLIVCGGQPRHSVSRRILLKDMDGIFAEILKSEI